ncbi:MAG TPA: hypothetical protein ENI98_07480 [Gammaproteobacteria bacterium]|nr:hypothetical protein [Gammaproteobacteria bacterium]
MNDRPDNEAPSRQPVVKRRGWLFIILILGGIIFFSRQQPVTTVNCTPEVLATRPDVIMLGAWWCSYCYKAKRYFQNNNIHYCEYDMENTEEGRRLYEKHGGGAIPILLIGKYRLSGFSEQQIEQALAQLKQKPQS